MPREKYVPIEEIHTPPWLQSILTSPPAPDQPWLSPGEIAAAVVAAATGPAADNPMRAAQVAGLAQKLVFRQAHTRILAHAISGVRGDEALVRAALAHDYTAGMLAAILPLGVDIARLVALGALDDHDKLMTLPDGEAVAWAIERCGGWESFAKNLDCLDTDPKHGTLYALRAPLRGCVLIVTCPSTGKRHVLTTPPVKSAEEARIWTFHGLRPEVET